MNLSECTVGQTLPGLELPLDRSTIAATAIASQDFEDVHHDLGAAQERGTPDVFMSINATNGFVDRYITDWTGPTARIRRASLRLGVPAFPGDPLQMSGEVTAVENSTVTVKVQGRNSKGVHVTAEVVVEPYERKTP